MCQTVGWFHPTLKSLFNKTFYKVLVSEKFGPYTIYKSPFMRMYVNIGETYIIPGKIDVKTYEEPQPNRQPYREIRAGVFHLMRNKKEAEEFMEYIRQKIKIHGWNETPVIVKAVVPAGTKFMFGTFGAYGSVVAKSVRYELIDQNEK